MTPGDQLYRAVTRIFSFIIIGFGIAILIVTFARGASIVIALFPDHADDEQGLRRAADAAMYSVKRSGKNRFAFAAPIEHEPSKARVQ